MYIHNLDPVLLDFGFIEIRWYSLAYIFGIVLGWWLGKKIVKIIRSFLKINCKLSELEEKLLDFAIKNNLKKNIFRNFKSILNLKKLHQDINFISNFGREVEYYTGIVFEVFSGNREIARGGRYDDLLKSLGSKKNIPAVGAAINLKNL